MSESSRPPRVNFLSNPSFDRAAHRRLDGAWLDAARAAPEAWVVPLWQVKPLVAGEGDATRAALLPAASFDWSTALDSVFLGVTGGIPYFAVDVSGLSAEDAAARFGAHGAFTELLMAAFRLPAEEAALLAFARGILWWHQRHRFCGVCGSPTVSVDGGHRRLCTNPSCKAEQFPRSDPAVIVLVAHGDECLLARGARFPGNMRSVLAGFVEPGEALEDTVAREVFEETGVRVTDIAYASSQPWPFPSSLMLGFRARALNTELTLDPSEIVEAGWYSKSWIRALGSDGPFGIPPPVSIARRLIDEWLAEG